MNSIVHPFIRKEYNDVCERLDEKYILFESAILFDTSDKIKTDFNILVVADLNIRIKRVQERNSISIEDIIKRIESQSDDEYKKNFADYIIYNNGNEEILEKQIIEVHNKILSL